MNKNLLRSIMVLHGDNSRSLAAYLDISEQTFCAKLNGNKAEFKQGEVALISKRYSLSADQIAAIFFS